MHNNYYRGNRAMGHYIPNGAQYQMGPAMQQLRGFGEGAPRMANPNQWQRVKDNVDPETRRKIENCRQLAYDQILRLQNVVSKRYAFNDANLADFYLQWRLASSVIAALSTGNTPTDKAIQSEIIHQYARVFALIVKIPFYAKTLNVENLREILLRT